MTKVEKLFKRFLNRPKDLTWEELTKVLSFFGYQEQTGGAAGGSRRKFIHKSLPIIIAHKPHPQNIVKTYLINQIIDLLEQENLI